MTGYLARLLMVCLVLGAAGCAQQPVETAPPELPPPEPEPERVPVETEPRPEPEPRPPARAEEPPVEPPEPVARELADTIAIVLSDRRPAFENVATELGRRLDDYLLYNLADRSLPPSEVFAGIGESDASAVIAIGLVAAREAIRRSKVPVVFCQVFNLAAEHDTAVPVRGVASTPPLSRHVAVWKQLNPELQSIGAILGPGHEALVAEAEQAAAAHGIVFHHRTATSDRETLFTFQRLTPAIDGFWLFPDNRVLSVEILEELLDYASRHDVDVAVFNHALLDMGATLSATTVDADIAATTLSVVTRIVRGEVDDVPWMTPLREVRIAARKGMPVAVDAAAGGRP